MSRGVVLWDFDGTLAERPGRWSGCVMEVLDELDPDHRLTLEALRNGLRHGFPWHTPDEPHPQLCEPGRWWEVVQGHLASVLEAAGLPGARCAGVAEAVRQRYIDPSRGWVVYDDAAEALATVAGAGWRNVVLSNHVPELPALVEGLGLRVDAVFTSAATGYEKPHPEAFARARGAARRAWMVGDNPRADVEGARAAGLQAILVRHPEGMSNLGQAAGVIAGS